RIVKIVAGEDAQTLDTLAALYGSIVKAGIHRAPSIKVAEMAKAIENAQRDLNIAYMNEIAKFCNRMGIRTKDVLDAAKTKWNFLPFSPGLVGGHCIGVDPYYLLEKAKDLGGKMPMVTAARKTNDKMPIFVWEQIVGALKNPKGKRVLVLGLTFKEDVPDARNSKSMHVIELLQKSGCMVTTHDTYHHNHAFEGLFDAIILLVPHREYRAMRPDDFRKIANDSCIFYDLKSVFEKEEMETAGFRYLAL
ncbi:MAG TPA: nucleotide sugar dehydrogenase, partial [Candidatus Peribacterales bacterium]|nr:nucleotide sugar dehydrogenase [Candidatus Peribacterales bacterium]